MLHNRHGYRFDKYTTYLLSYVFRKEIIDLDKLKKSVQSMTKKNFSEKFLRQIKCVFPLAYNYAWEKVTYVLFIVLQNF